MGSITPWDEKLARRVVRALVARRAKAGHFGAFSELGRGDVVSEALIAARRAWASYDPAKSSPSTWINRTASCRIIDLLRGANRRREREMAYVVNKPGVSGDGANDEGELPTLSCWLTNTYRSIRRTFHAYGIPPPLRDERLDGRRHAQGCAAIALKRRLEIKTNDETAEFIMGRRVLRDAIDLRDDRVDAALLGAAEAGLVVINFRGRAAPDTDDAPTPPPPA